MWVDDLVRDKQTPGCSVVRVGVEMWRVKEIRASKTREGRYKSKCLVWLKEMRYSKTSERKKGKAV